MICSFAETFIHYTVEENWEHQIGVNLIFFCNLHIANLNFGLLIVLQRISQIK